MTVQQSQELQDQIARWRSRQADGTMTPQDWTECFLTLRAHRAGAQAASAASKARKAAPARSATEIKDSLKAFIKKG